MFSFFLLQGEGGKFRRAPSWRKKFRNKEGSRSGEEGEATAAGAIPNSPDMSVYSAQQSPQNARRNMAVLAHAAAAVVAASSASASGQGMVVTATTATAATGGSNQPPPPAQPPQQLVGGTALVLADGRKPALNERHC